MPLRSRFRRRGRLFLEVLSFFFSSFWVVLRFTFLWGSRLPVRLGLGVVFFMIPIGAGRLLFIDLGLHSRLQLETQTVNMGIQTTDHLRITHVHTMQVKF